MATTLYTINETDGWIEIVDTSSDFLIENVNAPPVRLIFASASPGIAAEGFHTLSYKEKLTRPIQGIVYARNDDPTVEAKVAVSI